MRKAHDAAVRRGGIAVPFRLYDLRHTYATRAAQAGVDVLTLAALLEHTTVQMTSRYVHPTDQYKREAMEKLETYNAEGIFRYAETVSGSLQKPLNSGGVQESMNANSLRVLVGARGFEPRTSCAQGRRATRLRYAPTLEF